LNFNITGDYMMKMQIKTLASTAAIILAGVSATSQPVQAKDHKWFPFPIIRTAGSSPACAPDAKGVVKVKSLGPVEVMDVYVEGLPQNTDFDAFIIQVPNAPFGMSWYQGDLHTNNWGKGYARFVGRFNKETFVVAPKTTVAPKIHKADASSNPATAPVHTYHVGIWFNSPADAVKAGCSDKKTPFNGEHNAGVQILNSGTYPATSGPLLSVKP
jgi:hypothetical protein